MHGSLGIASFCGPVVPRLLKAESVAQVGSELLAGRTLIWLPRARSNYLYFWITGYHKFPGCSDRAISAKSLRFLFAFKYSPPRSTEEAIPQPSPPSAAGISCKKNIHFAKTFAEWCLGSICETKVQELKERWEQSELVTGVRIMLNRTELGFLA